MSAERLGFSDRSFSAVTISFGLRNVVDKKKALAEFSRVLRPQGSLLILEFFPLKAGLLNTLFQFYFQRILPVIGGLFSDKQAYQYLPQSVGSFLTVNELEQQALVYGLKLARKKSFLFGSCMLVEFRK